MAAGMTQLEELTAIHYKTVERIMRAQLYAQCLQAAAAMFVATVPGPVTPRDTEYAADTIQASAKVLYDTALETGKKP